MNDSDVIVVVSFSCLMSAIYASYLRLGKKAVPTGFILIAFSILFLGFCQEDQTLAKSLVFGIIAGTICQPLIADPYLTKKTLIYRKEGWLFVKTPWWMSLLWGIVIAQLLYLFQRLANFSETSPIRKFLALNYLLLIAGVVYFYVVELITNNLTRWWIRKNCRQPLNVAIYAILSEIFTVFLILTSTITLNKNSDWSNVLPLASITGVFIATGFIVSCGIFSIFYEP